MRLRSVGFFLSLSLFLSIPAHATTIIEVTSDESRIDFGTGDAQHAVLPVGDLSIVDNGLTRALSPWNGLANGFGASGPLVAHTVDTDIGGDVTASHYVYHGGTFSMAIALFNSQTGERRGGGVLLPILDMTVFVVEAGNRRGQVETFYRLGAGLLDADLADALGIGRHITGGEVYDPYLEMSDSQLTDYTAGLREAGEGGPTVTMRVPEPSSFILFGIAVMAALRRRGVHH